MEKIKIEVLCFVKDKVKGKVQSWKKNLISTVVRR